MHVKTLSHAKRGPCCCPEYWTVLQLKCHYLTYFQTLAVGHDQLLVKVIGSNLHCHARMQQCYCPMQQCYCPSTTKLLSRYMYMYGLSTLELLSTYALGTVKLLSTYGLSTVELYIYCRGTILVPMSYRRSTVLVIKLTLDSCLHMN